MIPLRYSATAALFCLGLTAATAACAAPIDVHVSRIETFKPYSGQVRFGSLEFVGGLQMTSNEALFGAWSSIRFLDDDQHFIGVLDTGHWLSGRIVRDDEGRISGLAEVDLSPMADAAGKFMQGKSLMDAESVALRGNEVLVGFEQRHRIDVYPRVNFQSEKPVKSLELPFPVTELRRNGGLETIAVSPVSSPLHGGVITIAERSVDENGNLFAGVVDGPLKGQFRVVRHNGFDATDGAFLPNGDFILLERRFSLATGVGMRIRRFKAADIKAGSVADGEVLMEADFGYQIDNMEGLDVIKAADGSTHLILVSDDNHSILQRNLMLEFRLVD